MLSTVVNFIEVRGRESNAAIWFCPCRKILSLRQVRSYLSNAHEKIGWRADIPPKPTTDTKIASKRSAQNTSRQNGPYRYLLAR